MQQKGITPDVVERQIDYFRTGFPFLPIVTAAVVGDGITRLTPEETDRLAEVYDREARRLAVVKFVPASGAASRMFKEMYEFVNDGKESDAVRTALNELKKFAFYDELMSLLPAEADERTIVQYIIEKGLRYGKSPKALILFHRYPAGSRTALEEHLCEGALYATSGDGTAHIHFTLSPEHEAGFRALVDRVRGEYERQFGVTYRIDYSQQKPKTDTIAVDLNNEPFREKDGSILFRPGGHGALLENLNDIDADLIFIKTIDNVCPDRMKPTTTLYKKALAGLLLERQTAIFHYLARAEWDEATTEDVAHFAQERLSWAPAPDFPTLSTAERERILRSVLDRPIRVCGMVKNEGEPGGGPFWVQNSDGSLSLQIAESSQIAPEQKGLMQEATHFNPVDLVCGVRNYKGEKYDLTRYVDPQTGFISTKSKDGRELKAQELPGLWNGAMARWNTIFVEVPIETFNPVKTVNDLLRPQHQ
ncbi:MAG: DUF4301 family protein [Rikenellaceae bacterium]|nr:DUF4301 family protein [Rikenellaceae bacterium]